MCSSVGHHHHNHPQTSETLPTKGGSKRAPEAAFKVVTTTNQQGRQELLSVQRTGQTVTQDEVLLTSTPDVIDCDTGASSQQYVEKYVAESALTEEQQTKYAQDVLKSRPQWEGSEVRTIVDQGPTDNRIDLTIVGDGYTESEKARFFADVKRLADDMFIGQTFASYLPLFNVHAVFVPSKESGLSDLERKDTALGLYRSPQGSKRGVMPGNRRAIENALALSPDTDYPILVANDDFYGGLGGRYAITTRSHNSGTMVLRHELGHNFGNVGEEYDGGQVYSGANHSSSTNLPWKHWMSEDGKIHDAKALATGYPWENLSKGPISLDFKVPTGDENGPMKIGIDVSSVGWEGEKDVEILLDGKPQKYEGVYTKDRSFFRLKDAQSLPAGEHKLTIREINPDGDNVVAAIRINAYPADYDFAADKVGGYPTFNHQGRHVGYRPTHESCLMRDMRSTKFCAVDQENMWHKFLNRVDLIDSVEVKPLQGRNGEGENMISVETPQLDGLDIRWYARETQQDGSSKEVELEHLRGQKRWVAHQGDDAGDYRVEVRFATEEVRHYSDRFRTTEDFSLS